MLGWNLCFLNGHPWLYLKAHKLLFRLLWVFQRTVALFRQIRTFPQLFRFCSDSWGFRDGHDLLSANLGVWSCVEFDPYLEVRPRGGMMRLASGVLSVISSFSRLWHHQRCLSTFTNPPSDCLQQWLVVTQIQSWMTINKTEISAQHEFLKLVS